ncbi:hypothetical protein HDU92_005005 [Lobulomyces angularis]|nr:hypothetical protein HDU92_005005 [Lobulomyces angularis]
MKPIVTVIGGGVVGLATAYKLSLSNNFKIILLEKNKFLATETSARNSQVIHAGIYYPNNYLKTKLCVKGNRMLYSFCNKYNVGYNKIGKFIIANNDHQVQYLLDLKEKKSDFEIPLEFITQKKVLLLEPNLVNTKLALSSPSTGILDVHEYCQALEGLIRNNGEEIVTNTTVKNIKKSENGYEVDTGEFRYHSDIVINSAGLQAINVSNLLFNLGLKLNSSKKLVSRLIYPCPTVPANANLNSLGIHCTLDLNRNLKFGPDLNYMKEGEELNYSLDENSFTSEKKIKFYEEIVQYLPQVKVDELVVDYCGIRPKLSSATEFVKDFYIADESKNGFKNFINLIGIESPGITASLAIAEMVESIIKENN